MGQKSLVIVVAISTSATGQKSLVVADTSSIATREKDTIITKDIASTPTIGQESLVIATTISIFAIVAMMFLLYGIFIRKKSQLLLTQKEKDIKFEQELAGSQVEMKEQTLNYIGQELHDDLGQKLSVVRLRSNQLITKMEGKNKTELVEINELLGECIQDIRNLSKTLITEQIEHFGLVDSIEREVKRIEKLQLLKIDFHTNKHDIDINPKHGLILFRIIQETINNILKHSRAKKLSINLNDDEKNLLINITDNGKGFNLSEAKDGSGLKNMNSRAKLINAEYALMSELDKGTKTILKYNKL